MRWVRSIAGEVLGLFVDDGPFAITIVLWLLVAGLALPRIGVPRVLDGLVLFLGLAVILVESAHRRSRRR